MNTPNQPTPSAAAMQCAKSILSGGEYNGIRWHGPDANNQWCWQFRGEKEVSRLIEAHTAQAVAAATREMRDCLQEAATQLWHVTGSGRVKDVPLGWAVKNVHDQARAILERHSPPDGQGEAT